MAGYIFAVSKEMWDLFVKTSLYYGEFSPLVVPYENGSGVTSRKKKKACQTLAAFYGDLITMQEGDNIYFLSNRKIYGIGKAVNVGPDCKYDNYLNASALLPDNERDMETSISSRLDLSRWFVIFEPDKYFFKKGLDMDDILKFRPNAFKMLRAFEGRSFIKIDDEENRALKEFISLNNEFAYEAIDDNVFNYSNIHHEQLKTANLNDYIMDIEKSLKFQDNFEFVDSEMFIESLFMQKLIRKEFLDIGNWDYITHQLIASPFKPIKYVDWIDIYGYKFSKFYSIKPELIVKYLLIETKHITVNDAAVEQTMQYLDWISKEYASDNYSMIDAYIIGPKFKRNLEENISEINTRSYIKESHPAKSEKWCNLKFIEYAIDLEKYKVNFNLKN